MSETSPHATYPTLLAAQLRLVRERRAEVARLLAVGGRHDEALVDAVTNDLVGARLVIRAAVAVPPPNGVSGAAREDLQRQEREAADLLRTVLFAPGGGTRPARDGHQAPGSAGSGVVRPSRAPAPPSASEPLPIPRDNARQKIRLMIRGALVAVRSVYRHPTPHRGRSAAEQQEQEGFENKQRNARTPGLSGGTEVGEGASTRAPRGGRGSLRCGTVMYMMYV